MKEKVYSNHKVFEEEDELSQVPSHISLVLLTSCLWGMWLNKHLKMEERLNSPTKLTIHCLLHHSSSCHHVLFLTCAEKVKQRKEKKWNDQTSLFASISSYISRELRCGICSSKQSKHKKMLLPFHFLLRKFW